MQILELNTRWGCTEKVELTINQYLDNKSLYIGLNTVGEEPEPYANITVNLDGKPPGYCAYVDTGNMPELEEFIVENELGYATGLMKRSGFNEYPLYLFNVKKLRELCPDGLAAYEKENGLERREETKEKDR